MVKSIQFEEHAHWDCNLMLIMGFAVHQSFSATRYISMDQQQNLYEK